MTHIRLPRLRELCLAAAMMPLGATAAAAAGASEPGGDACALVPIADVSRALGRRAGVLHRMTSAATAVCQFVAAGTPADDVTITTRESSRADVAEYIAQLEATEHAKGRPVAGFRVPALEEPGITQGPALFVYTQNVLLVVTAVVHVRGTVDTARSRVVEARLAHVALAHLGR